MSYLYFLGRLLDNLFFKLIDSSILITGIYLFHILIVQLSLLNSSKSFMFEPIKAHQDAVTAITSSYPLDSRDQPLIARAQRLLTSSPDLTIRVWELAMLGVEHEITLNLMRIVCTYICTDTC